MGHAMDPQKFGTITIMDLFCGAIPSPLKNINTIYPKTNKLLGKLVLWQTSTYHECFHKNLRLSLLVPTTTLSKDIKMGILT
jgi:hypothetical protein